MALAVLARTVLVMLDQGAKRKLLSRVVDGDCLWRHITLLIVGMGVLRPLQRQVRGRLFVGQGVAHAGCAHVDSDAVWIGCQSYACFCCDLPPCPSILPLQASPLAVLGPLLVEVVAHLSWLRTHTTYRWAPMLLTYAVVLAASAAMSAAIDAYRRRQFMHSVRAGNAPASSSAQAGLPAAAGCSAAAGCAADGSMLAKPRAAAARCAAMG
jgi:hypothetical protein